MRQAAANRHRHRVNALIVVLWRAGLPIQEALSLAETELDQRRGSHHRTRTSGSVSLPAEEQLLRAVLARG
jgi:hypothetical protein